jgi:hypothetical protein
MDGRYPTLGRSRRALGVVVEGLRPDIPVTPDGLVKPRTGGMSVSVDDPTGLPPHRLPVSMHGYSLDVLFSLDSAVLPGELAERPDRLPHAVIEPASVMQLCVYEEALGSTRISWLPVTVEDGERT